MCHLRALRYFGQRWLHGQLWFRRETGRASGKGVTVLKEELFRSVGVSRKLSWLYEFSLCVRGCVCYTIDTEVKAKRNNMISKLITFRITKAKLQFGVKYLCGHECERSSVQSIFRNINTKAKAKKYFWGIAFTSISVSTVRQTSLSFPNARSLIL